MSAQDLSELAWKRVAGRKVPNQNLARALAAYGACEERDSQGRIEALKVIDKHAEALRKEHSTGPIFDQLQLILKEAESVRKKLELTVKPAGGKAVEAKQPANATRAPEAKLEPAPRKEEEAKEEDDPDWQPKLISALAKVKALAPGEPEPGVEGEPQLRFLAYVLSDHCAVLVGARVNSSRALLKKIAGDASGGMYHGGECIFERGAHTFVLEQVPGGLAKKLGKALLAQTGQRYKVRVRGLDGTVEEDGEAHAENGAATPNTAAEKSSNEEAIREPGAAKVLGDNMQRLAAAQANQAVPPAKLIAVLSNLAAKISPEAGANPAAVVAIQRVLGACRSKLNEGELSPPEMAAVARNLKIGEILLKEQVVRMLRQDGAAESPHAGQIDNLLTQFAAARAQQQWAAGTGLIEQAFALAMPPQDDDAEAPSETDALRARLREKLLSWRGLKPGPLNDQELTESVTLLREGDLAGLQQLEAALGHAEETSQQIAPFLEQIDTATSGLAAANIEAVHGAIEKAFQRRFHERLPLIQQIAQKVSAARKPRARVQPIDTRAESPTAEGDAELVGQVQAERAAAESAAKAEADRKVQEEAARLEEERVAQEAARVEAERVAREQEAARAEAARRAEEAEREAQETARLEAERLAREQEAARREAERLAQEEAARVATEQEEATRLANLRREEMRIKGEINGILADLHTDLRESTAVQAAVAQAEAADGADDLEALEAARERLERFSAAVANQAQQRRTEIAQALGQLHVSERGQFVADTQQASRVPYDLSALREIATRVDQRIEEVARAAAEERDVISRLLGVITPEIRASSSDVLATVRDALREDPVNLQALIEARAEFQAHLTEISRAARAARAAEVGAPVTSEEPQAAATSEEPGESATSDEAEEADSPEPPAAEVPVPSVPNASPKEQALLQNLGGRHRAVATSLAGALQGTEPGIARTQLVTAVQFGPVGRPGLNYEEIPGLSADEKAARVAQTQQRADATAAVIKNFKDFPELTLDALDVLRDVEHPEAFADGIAKLGALLRGGFGEQAGSPDEARTMARNAMKLAGLVGGGSFFAEMEAYYLNDPAARQPDPLRTSDLSKDPHGAALLYGREMGKALVDASGNLAPGGITPMRNALRFHPESLKDPLATVTEHVESLHGQITRDPAGFQAALNSTTAPQTASAQGMVRATLGLDPNAPVNRRGAQQAVMSAMATPLRQGDVGSCFATSNCQDMQEQRPVEMTQHLAQMVSSGTLAVGTVDPVPIVHDAVPNRNRLLDSYQYTVATIGECAGVNAHALNNGAKGETVAFNLQAELGIESQEALDGVTDKCRQAIRYKYDPSKETGIGADGSSNKGGWICFRADNGQVVNTHDEYLDCMRDAMQRALPDVNPATLQGIRNGAEFQSNFVEDWQRRSGGDAKNSRSVLTGTKFEDENLFEPTGANASLTAAKKTEAVLAGLLKGTQTSVDKTVSLGIPGHALRVLAKHPSLDGLKGGNIDRKIAEVFEQAKTAKLDEAQVSSFSAKVAPTISKVLLGGGAELADPANQPAGELSMPELRQALLARAGAAIAKFTDDNFEANRQNPAFNTKAKLSAYITKQLGQEIDSLMLNDLCANSQFVVSDTNWGDAKQTILHVVAPDPATGDAVLWKKSKFDGSMTSTGEQWLQGNWSKLKVAA